MAASAGQAGGCGRGAGSLIGKYAESWPGWAGRGGLRASLPTSASVGPSCPSSRAPRPPPSLSAPPPRPRPEGGAGSLPRLFLFLVFLGPCSSPPPSPLSFLPFALETSVSPRATCFLCPSPSPSSSFSPPFFSLSSLFSALLRDGAAGSGRVHSSSLLECSLIDGEICSPSPEPAAERAAGRGGEGAEGGPEGAAGGPGSSCGLTPEVVAAAPALALAAPDFPTSASSAFDGESAGVGDAPRARCSAVSSRGDGDAGDDRRLRPGPSPLPAPRTTRRGSSPEPGLPSPAAPERNSVSGGSPEARAAAASSCSVSTTDACPASVVTASRGTASGVTEPATLSPGAIRRTCVTLGVTPPPGPASGVTAAPVVSFEPEFPEAFSPSSSSSGDALQGLLALTPDSSRTKDVSNEFFRRLVLPVSSASRPWCSRL